MKDDPILVTLAVELTISTQLRVQTVRVQSSAVGAFIAGYVVSHTILISQFASCRLMLSRNAGLIQLSRPDGTLFKKCQTRFIEREYLQ